MTWFHALRSYLYPIFVLRVDPLSILKCCFAATGIILFSINPIFAQNSASQPQQTTQQQAAASSNSTTINRKDPVALAELANHLLAVGGSSWVGMQGVGKIVYGSKDPNGYDATISNLGDHSFRLDAQTSKGEMSVRIHKRLGKIQSANGVLTPIPPDSAVMGLFPFEFARSAHFIRIATSIVDHGLVAVEGTMLHRITCEIPGIGRNSATKSQTTASIDLYFDPTSHLLLRTAESNLIADGRHARFRFVVDYSDYRPVGVSMIPFRYLETMEGQPYQVLQLSGVQLNPTFSSTYFDF